MAPTRRQILQALGLTGVSVGGTGILAYLLGYLSPKDLMTLNWADVRRNVPAFRCVFGCSEVQLLEDSDAYRNLNPEKNPANPILNSTSVSNVQAYPSSVIQVDGTYYATVGSWPQTVGFKSPNGTEWQEVNQDLIPRGEPDSFDTYKRTAQVFRYTPDSSKYHILYKGIDDNGSHRYGHAYSDQPLQGYTKSENNPILSSDVETEFQEVSGIHRLFISDFIIDDGEPIYFGVGTEAETGINFIWMGTGQLGVQVTPETILFTENDDELRVRSDPDPVEQPNVGSCSIIKINNIYVMAYSALANIKHYEHAAAQGKIYLAVGDSPGNIAPTNDLVLDTGDCNTWEELRVYQPRWLKRQDGLYTDPDLVDGKINLHYSGHDCGASKFFGNRGVTGVAEYPLSKLVEFVEQVSE